jgi:hypothetical protein
MDTGRPQRPTGHLLFSAGIVGLAVDEALKIKN